MIKVGKESHGPFKVKKVLKKSVHVEMAILPILDTSVTVLGTLPTGAVPHSKISRYVREEEFEPPKR